MFRLWIFPQICFILKEFTIIDKLLFAVVSINLFMPVSPTNFEKYHTNMTSQIPSAPSGKPSSLCGYIPSCYPHWDVIFVLLYLTKSAMVKYQSSHTPYQTTAGHWCGGKDCLLFWMRSRSQMTDDSHFSPLGVTSRWGRLFMRTEKYIPLIRNPIGTAC